MIPMDCYHPTHARLSCMGRRMSMILDEAPGDLTSRGDQVKLELRHLKLVRAIVREGGLTRAAARLHLTQPALSHQLRELERRLGAALFLRVGRGLVPTPAGERLVRTAEAVLPEVESVERELAAEGTAGA